MRFSLLSSAFQRFSSTWPILIYATSWTTLLTIMVAMASFAPEVAFVSKVSPSSSISKACNHGLGGFMRVPLDIPNEMLCFPPEMFRRSKMDWLVPPFFAAIVVSSCAYAVKAIGLWEADDDNDNDNDDQP
ncbi:hypothetical protein LIER_20038 [Lithospermum erythrorhizon]|uniref:Uncharacterized protein n=1 Tax=Lithospermum erythrorhizon TaxID=34254 RepID=A0AAV3QMY8_LITER